MKKSEIKLEECPYNMSAGTCKGHYKFIMSMGRLLPSTRAQAREFYRLFKQGRWMDVLNNKDMNDIESILNRHGFDGNYKYTKSRTWVRLINTTDLALALKQEYNI